MFFYDRAHTHPATVPHLHHFKDQMLTVFVADSRQRFPARFEFFRQCLNIFQITTAFGLSF